MITITNRVGSNKRGPCEIGISFHWMGRQSWHNISIDEFNKLSKLEGAIDVTYDTENNIHRCSSALFVRYRLEYGSNSDIVKRYYNDYVDKFESHFNSSLFIKCNNNVYFLGFKRPYCMPTRSEKGYSERKLSKTYIFANGYDCSSYSSEMDYIHETKLIKFK